MSPCVEKRWACLDAKLPCTLCIHIHIYSIKCEEEMAVIFWSSPEIARLPLLLYENILLKLGFEPITFHINAYNLTTQSTHSNDFKCIKIYTISILRGLVLHTHRVCHDSCMYMYAIYATFGIESIFQSRFFFS